MSNQVSPNIYIGQYTMVSKLGEGGSGKYAKSVQILFSFGAILHEMNTGRRAFRATRSPRP